MQKKKIPGYSRYTITQCGNVFGVRNRKLKTSNCNGYPVVTISRDDKKKTTIGVHRLMALTWIPNPLNLPVVDHKNGNREDYSLSNLRWVTQKENMQSAYYDRNQPSAILSVAKVNKIKALLSQGVSSGEIAKQYGVKTQTISSIRRGKIWKNASSEDS